MFSFSMTEVAHFVTGFGGFIYLLIQISTSTEVCDLTSSNCTLRNVCLDDCVSCCYSPSGSYDPDFAYFDCARGGTAGDCSEIGWRFDCNGDCDDIARNWINDVKSAFQGSLSTVDETLERVCEVANNASCIFNGQRLPHGHKIRYDACSICKCDNGITNCKVSSCLPLQCPPNEQIQNPNECCPVCPKELSPTTSYELSKEQSSTAKATESGSPSCDPNKNPPTTSKATIAGLPPCASDEITKEPPKGGKDTKAGLPPCAPNDSKANKESTGTTKTTTDGGGFTVFEVIMIVIVVCLSGAVAMNFFLLFRLKSPKYDAITTVGLTDISNNT